MNDEPDWNLYRTFLAVFHEGSLSGAARRLGLTQPTVGRHLDALEAALGARLFLRTPQGLSPSEVALRVLPFAERLQGTAAALLRAATDRADDVRGVVRVSASEVFGVERLPAVLVSLRRAHPGLVIELVLTNEVQDLLRQEADIAVRMADPRQQALIAHRLPSVPLGLFAHRDYLALRGIPASPADLAGHDVIGFDRETPALRRLVERFPDIDRARFALRCDSDLAQLAAIRAGFGIGMCQVGLARRDDRLVHVLPDAVRVELGLWIVMHEDLRSSPRCRIVFDALVAGLAFGTG